MGSYLEEVLRDRPLVYYPGFGDTGVANGVLRDWSGNGIDARLVNSSQATTNVNNLTSGPITAVPLPGNPPFFTCPATSTTLAQTASVIPPEQTVGALSIEAWWWGVPEWHGALISFWDGSAGVGFGLNSNDFAGHETIRLESGINAGQVLDWITPNATVAGWHHMAGVVRGAGALSTIYFDGVPVATGGVSFRAFTSNTLVSIPAGTVTPLAIAHIAGYAYALSDDQVQRHYNARGNRTSRPLPLGRRPLSPSRAALAGVWPPLLRPYAAPTAGGGTLVLLNLGRAQSTAAARAQTALAAILKPAASAQAGGHAAPHLATAAQLRADLATAAVLGPLDVAAIIALLLGQAAARTAARTTAALAAPASAAPQPTLAAHTTAAAAIAAAAAARPASAAATVSALRLSLAAQSLPHSAAAATPHTALSAAAPATSSAAARAQAALRLAAQCAAVLDSQSSLTAALAAIVAAGASAQTRGSTGGQLAAQLRLLADPVVAAQLGPLTIAAIVALLLGTATVQTTARLAPHLLTSAAAAATPAAHAALTPAVKLTVRADAAPATAATLAATLGAQLAAAATPQLAATLGPVSLATIVALLLGQAHTAVAASVGPQLRAAVQTQALAATAAHATADLAVTVQAAAEPATAASIAAALSAQLRAAAAAGVAARLTLTLGTIFITLNLGDSVLSVTARVVARFAAPHGAQPDAESVYAARLDAESSYSAQLAVESVYTAVLSAEEF